MPPPSPKPPPRREPVPAASAVPPPAGAPAETGWLPDLVYTEGKFEAGLAFFADGLGRIVRFSREPADLAVARRLSGQAAVPGLVNAHSQTVQRTLRGRFAAGTKNRGATSVWREAQDRMLTRLSAEDVFDTARHAFMEMLLAGITCVGEWHCLHHAVAGGAAEPNAMAQEILRAAHDVGIRLALFPAAGGVHPRTATTAAQFVRDAEALRQFVEKNFPADEAWLGIAVHASPATPADFLAAVGGYAHGRRMRLHVRLAASPDDDPAGDGAATRLAVARLAEHGLVDKRLTVIHAAPLTDDDIARIGAARAMVAACPSAERASGLAPGPLEKLLRAGVGVSLGSGSQVQIDLLEEARLLDYGLHAQREPDAAPLLDAALLLQAATVTGARCLGATGGGLEVGRPADFFTVNLFDPALAGASPAELLNHVVFSLPRRAIRDVWIGARHRILNGRHPNHGPIVGRFVETQRKLWAEA